MQKTLYIDTKAPNARFVTANCTQSHHQAQVPVAAAGNGTPANENSSLNSSAKNARTLPNLAELA